MGLTKDLGSIPRAITVNNSNNVLIGIGTDTNDKLQVNGNSKMTGDLRVGADNTEWRLTGFANGGAIWQKSNSATAGSNNRYLRLGNITNVGVANYVISIVENNTGIGSTNPKTTLQVSSNGAGSLPSLGSIGTATSLYLTNNNFDYGLLAGSLSSGNSWIQSQRTDTSATSYNLLLQPSGSNVLIGTQADNGNKLQVNGGITAVGLVLSGNHNITVGTNSGWSSYQNMVNPGVLQNDATFLISVKWYYTGAENQPYFCNCSFLFMGSYTNGGGVDNEFTPLCSTHTGNTGANISFRVIAGTGGSTSGIQARLNNFATRSGILTIRATRLD
jgi:hypothetical protein